MFTGTRSRLLLIGLVLLTVGVVALTWFLGVDPQLKSLERANAETTQQRGLNDLEQIAVAGLRAQSESIGDLRQELQDYRAGVPETQEQPELLRQLASAAAGTGVALTGVTSGEILAYLPPDWQQPAPDTGQGRLVGLTLEIEAEGDPGALRDFVASVQGLARYITVGSVAYTTQESGAKVQIAGTAWVLLSIEAAAQVAATDAPAAPAEEQPVEGTEGTQ